MRSRAWCRRTLLGDDDAAALRPRARVARAGGFTPARATTGLLERVNAGEICAAPPKTVPPAAVPDDRESLGGGRGSPGALPDWLRRPAAAAAGLALVAADRLDRARAALPAGPGDRDRAGRDRRHRRRRARGCGSTRSSRSGPPGGGPASVIDDETRTPAAVDELPTSSRSRFHRRRRRPEACPRRRGGPGPDSRHGATLQGGARATPTPSTSPSGRFAVLERAPLDLAVIARVRVRRHRSRRDDSEARSRRARDPDSDRRPADRGLRRGDGLSGDRRPDVRAADRPVERALPAQHPTARA